MITEILQFDFFRVALYGALLASIACGIIGTLVVVKDVSAVSGGLAHAAFGGVGLGYLFGGYPMLGATLFTTLLGVVLGALYLYRRDSLDTLVALFWSFGMALGVLALSFSPGYTSDVTGYLFGNILLVSSSYLAWAIALDLAIVLFVFFLFKELKAITFDEEFSRVLGVRITPVFLLFMALVALTVVVLIRLVGMILTIALLTVPALIARHWVRTLSGMIAVSTALTALISVGGLFLSYGLARGSNTTVPPGPVIVLVAIVLYVVSLVVRRRPEMR